MAVYKDNKTNTWRVVYRIPDWKGGTKQSQKRGFSTKRDALAWEREFLNKAHADLSMTFESFIESYAHLFPSTQNDMADKLNNFRKEPTKNVS